MSPFGAMTTGDHELVVEFTPLSRVVCPSSHHLTAVPDQSIGSADYWRTAGGQFQALYSGSHFVDAGVTGSVTIQKLAFRGADGWPDLGGQRWVAVDVWVGRTAQTTLSDTFATNLSNAVTVTQATVTVDVGPSSGATPNNDNITIDLAAAMAPFTFHPTSAFPNLLVGVRLPPAIVPAGATDVAPVQTTSGSIADAHGLWSNSMTAATGTLSSSPPVIAVEFDGDHVSLPPARNEYYGAACGGAASSFYQSFLPGQRFELIGLRLTPDQWPFPTSYTVSAGAAPFDASQVDATPESIADDGIVAHNVGYPLGVPGGFGGTIYASTNGFVRLQNNPPGTHHNPNVGDFLGRDLASQHRWAPCWYDFHAGRNSGAFPNAGLHVRTVGQAGNRVTYVTWYRVGVHHSRAGSGHAVYDMQMAIHEVTGVVEYRYGSMPEFCGFGRFGENNDTPAIVGFSRGATFFLGQPPVPAVDPQTRDLSIEVPFQTPLEGSRGNLGLRAIGSPVVGSGVYGGRAFAGQSLTWRANNIPPGSLLGVLILDVGSSQPGISIPGIHASGCIESTTLNPLIWEVFVLPASTVTGTVPLAYPAQLFGSSFHAQFAMLDGLFGGPDIVTALSNAIRHTVGKR